MDGAALPALTADKGERAAKVHIDFNRLETADLIRIWEAVHHPYPTRRLLRRAHAADRQPTGDRQRSRDQPELRLRATVTGEPTTEHCHRVMHLRRTRARCCMHAAFSAGERVLPAGRLPAATDLLRRAGDRIGGPERRHRLRAQPAGAHGPAAGWVGDPGQHARGRGSRPARPTSSAPATSRSSPTTRRSSPARRCEGVSPGVAIDAAGNRFVLCAPVVLDIAALAAQTPQAQLVTATTCSQLLGPECVNPTVQITATQFFLVAELMETPARPVGQVGNPGVVRSGGGLPVQPHGGGRAAQPDLVAGRHLPVHRLRRRHQLLAAGGDAGDRRRRHRLPRRGVRLPSTTCRVSWPASAARVRWWCWAP